MTHNCAECRKPVLLVKDQDGRSLILDATSRKAIWELSDSSVELVAARTDAREIYADHSLLCSGKRGET